MPIHKLTQVREEGVVLPKRVVTICHGKSVKDREGPTRCQLAQLLWSQHRRLLGRFSVRGSPAPENTAGRGFLTGVLASRSRLPLGGASS